MCLTSTTTAVDVSVVNDLSFTHTTSHSGHSAADQLCSVLEAIFLHELKDRRGVLWRERHKPNQLDLPEPVRERGGGGRERKREIEKRRSFYIYSHSGLVLSRWCQMKSRCLFWHCVTLSPM